MKKLIGFCPSCKYRLTAVALEEKNQGNSFHNNFAQMLFGYLNRDQTAFVALFLKHKGSLSSLITEIPMTLPQAEKQLQQILDTLGLTSEPLFPEKSAPSQPSVEEKTEKEPPKEIPQPKIEPQTPTPIQEAPSSVKETLSSDSSEENGFLFPLDKPLDGKVLHQLLHKAQQDLQEVREQQHKKEEIEEKITYSVPQFMPKRHHQPAEEPAPSIAEPVQQSTNTPSVQPAIFPVEQRQPETQPNISTSQPQPEELQFETVTLPVLQPVSSEEAQPEQATPVQPTPTAPLPQPSVAQTSPAPQPQPTAQAQPSPEPQAEVEPKEEAPSQIQAEVAQKEEQPSTVQEEIPYTPVRQPVLRHILQQAEPIQNSASVDLLTSLLKKPEKAPSNPKPSQVAASPSKSESSPKASEIIRQKLLDNGGIATVLSVTGKPYHISVRPDGNGFLCDKLPNGDGYDYQVFDIVVDFLQKKGGKAEKGTAKGVKLGDAKCDENTVVGIVAKKYHKAKKGDSVPDPVFILGAVLEWAGIAKNGRGYLELL